jgi:hypothetical protein
MTVGEAAPPIRKRGELVAFEPPQVSKQCYRRAPGTIVRMPANVPHAVDATASSLMLLIMLRAVASPQ